MNVVGNAAGAGRDQVTTREPGPCPHGSRACSLEKNRSCRTASRKAGRRRLLSLRLGPGTAGGPLRVPSPPPPPHSAKRGRGDPLCPGFSQLRVAPPCKHILSLLRRRGGPRAKNDLQPTRQCGRLNGGRKIKVSPCCLSAHSSKILFKAP